jgi:hypothetical protein|tara:strand:- start:36 stop:308 length:273 start_codon:yes stop_codon:yes gene_type:complete
MSKPVRWVYGLSRSLAALKQEGKMTEQEKKNALSIVWDALHDYRENCIPQFNDNKFEADQISYDEQWDEITGAMAEITEELGLDSGQPHD